MIKYCVSRLVQKKCNYANFHNLKDEIHDSEKPKFLTAVAMATMITLTVNFGFCHFSLMAILNR